MLITPQIITQLNLLYSDLVGQIKDSKVQLDLYLGTKNYINQGNISVYFKDYALQKDLANYLLISLQAKIALNANYTITTSQITDLNTYAINFLTITQSSPTGLDKNYYIQPYQVRNDLLKNIQSPNVNSVYIYQANSVQNQYGSTTFDLLPLQKLQSTFTKYYSNNALNNQKYFVIFDLSKSPSYMQIIAQTDIKISSSQIPDLTATISNLVVPTFANYLPINPPQQTALNTNYTIKQSQITDLAPVDMSKYMPLNPTSQITLNSKFIVRTWSLIDDSITGNKKAYITIIADRMQIKQLQQIKQHLTPSLIIKQLQIQFYFKNYIQTLSLQFFNTEFMFVTLWILAEFFKQMKQVLFVNLHNNQQFQVKIKSEMPNITQDLRVTCTQEIQTQIVQISNNHLLQ